MNPEDMNRYEPPPKNAAYWKRRAKKAEETLAEREAWFEKCIAMWKQEEVMWKERETELLATLNMKWAGTKPE